MADSPMIPKMDWSSAAAEFGEAQEARLVRQVFACYACLIHKSNPEPPAVVVQVQGTTYCVDHVRYEMR